MVRPRTQRQANLADNLRPHVQRHGGVFPLREWQGRPVVFGVCWHVFDRHSERSRGTPPNGRTVWLRDSSTTLRSARNDIMLYSRLMKSENDRRTFSNIPRASSCALLKPCLMDRFAFLMTPVPSP